MMHRRTETQHTSIGVPDARKITQRIPLFQETSNSCCFSFSQHPLPTPQPFLVSLPPSILPFFSSQDIRRLDMARNTVTTNLKKHKLLVINCSLTSAELHMKKSLLPFSFRTNLYSVVCNNHYLVNLHFEDQHQLIQLHEDLLQ